MEKRTIKAKQAQLHTEHLLLRGYKNCDAEPMIELMTNADITRTFMVPMLDTREKALKLVQRIVELSLKPDHFEYAVCLEETEQMIGFVNDCAWDEEQSLVELGYVIHPEFWGRGYATEVLRACIEELFSMGFETVRAGWFAENPASGRVMEKCGMHLIDKVEREQYRGEEHMCYYCEIKNPCAKS